MPIQTWLIYIPIATGIVLFFLGIPLQLKKIKPNRLYGFRTKKTLSNETIWYAANQYAGKTMVITGILTIIASVAVLILFKNGCLRLNKDSFALIVVALILVPTIILTVLSLLKLRKL